MSEPKLISPLLDGFVVGEPMGSHHGVRCCPAIREDTDERYIVKIISIPASQVQLDALLLTGAYADQEEALVYFKELSEGVTGEADILTRLSRLEGFVPYLGHQTAQMEEGIGYEVYLISPYRRTLEKQMCVAPLTQLDAVNLGLDLCAALAVARRAGYLYANLKPGNIFCTETQGYRIGDLGFIPLSSLKYASLPEKYRSNYTAPEVCDAMSALNDTIDIYALGLTLYQVYNNGQLPFEGSAPSEQLPPPMYADYEMAEIILKACAPDPQDRWQDPAQMGQALVNYMQRNSVNATPIVPPPVEAAPEPEQEEEFLSEDENEAALSALLEQLPEEIPPVEAILEDIIQEDDSSPEEPDETPEDEDLSMIEQASAADETLPTEESAAEVEGNVVTEEVAQMLAQADELISHELPDPVIPPEPIDVPFPPPIVAEPEVPEETEAAQEEPPTEPSEDEETVEPAKEAEAEPVFAPNATRRKRKRKKINPGPLIAAAVTLVVLAALVFGGRLFYKHVYLQTVDALTVQGTVDQMSVSVSSEIDDDLLTVICTDTYGNTQRSPVSSGVARFVNLNPSTHYRITLEISGFHKLQGVTTGSYTTAARTEILNFTAVSGPEDGSVILSFSVNGPEHEGWSVEYFADGIAPKTQDFSGHTVTISGLTIDALYTFRLVPQEDLYLSGNDELTFTARKIVYAQNLTVTGWDDTGLSVQWALPEGIQAQTWLVRCYNDDGFDASFTTEDCSFRIEGLDTTTGYTIKVTAEGMTQGVTTSVTGNPVTVTGLTATPSSGSLNLTWTVNGTAPVSGWVLTYTIDGGEAKTATCMGTSAIVPLYPGSHYEFSLQPVDTVTCFCQDLSYDAPNPAAFEGYLVTAADMDFSMCRTPEQENWDRHNLKDSDYKTTFAVGEKASFLVHLNKRYNTSDDVIRITYIVRDANGQPVSRSTQSSTWTKMWHKKYCELDVPQMPTAPGTYTVEVYFNDLSVTTQSFTIA